MKERELALPSQSVSALESGISAPPE